MLKGMGVALRVSSAVLIIFSGAVVHADTMGSNSSSLSTGSNSAATFNQSSGFFIARGQGVDVPASNPNASDSQQPGQNANASFVLANEGYFLVPPASAKNSDNNPVGFGGGGGAGGFGFGSGSGGAGNGGSSGAASGSGNNPFSPGINGPITGGGGINGGNALPPSGSTPGGFNLDQSTPVNVTNPEPASLLLLGTGLAGLALWRRSQKQKQ